MKIKRMKLFAFAFIALIGGCLFAQENGGWVSPYVGLSTLNNDNKVADLYGGQSKVLNSWSAGFELGYTFNNLYLFVSVEDEFVNMSDDDVCIESSVNSVAINAGYPIWKIGSNGCSLDARIGFGLYNSKIEKANKVIALGTEIVKQNYNLFIPVGLTLNVPVSTGINSRMSLLYRQSIETGSSKYFGTDEPYNNYPFNKLGSLYFSIGFTFGI